MAPARSVPSPAPHAVRRSVSWPGEGEWCVGALPDPGALAAGVPALGRRSGDPGPAGRRLTGRLAVGSPARPLRPFSNTAGTLGLPGRGRSALSGLPLGGNCEQVSDDSERLSESPEERTARSRTPESPAHPAPAGVLIGSAIFTGRWRGPAIGGARRERADRRAAERRAAERRVKAQGRTGTGAAPERKGRSATQATRQPRKAGGC